LWHNGFRPLIVGGHLSVVFVVSRSSAPPARPKMLKIARAYARVPVVGGTRNVLHEQDKGHRSVAARTRKGDGG
jgi:hypothetical protein